QMPIQFGTTSRSMKVPIFTIPRIEVLKSTLVEKLGAEFKDVEPRLLYLAVNEAAALASLTPVPLLLLPSLAEEKVRSAAAWSADQRCRRDPGCLSLAA